MSRGAKLVLRIGGSRAFISEPIAKGSGKGVENRERNICEHPLVRLKATGRITEAQYDAGDRYRELHEILQRSGVDSTQRIAISGARSGWSDAQCDAESRLRRIDARLSHKNCLILWNLCGQAFEPRTAVLRAVRCHPNGITLRIQEALDELIGAIER